MNNRPFILLLLVLLFLTCFILPSNALTSSLSIQSSGTIIYTPTPQDGWLHTDGIYVKNSQDQTVAIRGIYALWHLNFINIPIFLDNAKAHGITYIQLSFRLPDDDSGMGLAFDTNTDFPALDQVIATCKQKGMFVVLCYHHSSTNLMNMLDDVNTVNDITSRLQTLWTPIIEHYKNEPTVMGIRMLDEPNFSGVEEAGMYYQVIGALRQINPNLLWFTHTICEVRFGEQYFHMIPWKTNAEVPYQNIVMDGGMWIADYNTDFGYNMATYAEADALFNDVTTRLENFRTNVGIPCGLTPGINEHYDDTSPTAQARIYFLNKLHLWLEQNKYMLNLYAADYQFQNKASNGLIVFDAIFTDIPYPSYW